MTLLATEVATLPKLAWCARVRRGDDTVVLWHGPSVEVRADAFVEGAWDGPFHNFAFDDALTMTGSGGRCTPDGFLFAASSYIVERLFSIATGDALFVSNSLVFVMVAADREPDPGYVHYFPDWIAHVRAGITSKVKRLPLDRGFVRLHDAENFVVTSDLSITRRAKPVHDTPESFTSYRRLLAEATRALCENANAPQRRQRYTPLVSVSRGYDAPAVAVLAREAGCRSAMTIRNRNANAPDQDSGLDIGRRLGLDVSVYDFYDFHHLPVSTTAEFRATPRGADLCLASAEPELRGKFLLNGRYGDVVWSLKPSQLFKDYLYPGGQSGGSSMLEFRLRVGFMRMEVPYIAARDPRSIYRRITMSSEMAPWMTGNGYDRPIARRIVEEAGIPREWFGNRKYADAHIRERPRDVGTALHRDYLDFVRSRPHRRAVWSRLADRSLRELARLTNGGTYLAERSIEATGRIVRLPTRLPLRYVWPTSLLPLAMQHGFARTRSRYDGVVTE